jgi:hypothetical protein
LTGGATWNTGYRVIALIQLVLTFILVISLPIWKKRETIVDEHGEEVPAQALSMKEILSIKGAKDIMIAFFCYCALEQTAGLWASSYMVLHKGVAEEIAASYASMFYIGITLGRFVSGFITAKLNDKQMIRLGMTILAAGVGIVFLPLDLLKQARGDIVGTADGGALFTLDSQAVIFRRNILAGKRKGGERRVRALFELQGQVDILSLCKHRACGVKGAARGAEGGSFFTVGGVVTVQRVNV